VNESPTYAKTTFWRGTNKKPRTATKCNETQNGPGINAKGEEGPELHQERNRSVKKGRGGQEKKKKCPQKKNKKLGAAEIDWANPQATKASPINRPKNAKERLIYPERIGSKEKKEKTPLIRKKSSTFKVAKRPEKKVG